MRRVAAAVLRLAQDTEARRLLRGDMRRNVADEVSEQVRMLSYRLTDRFDELERSVREQMRQAEEDRQAVVVPLPVEPRETETVEAHVPEPPKRRWWRFGR